MFQIDRLERFAAASGDWAGFEKAKADYDRALTTPPTSSDERDLLRALGVTDAG